MTSPPISGVRNLTFFDLSAELRTLIYTLVLESEVEILQGDNKAEVMDGDYSLSVDCKSLEKTQLPAICQVSSQIRHETRNLLALTFSDWLPAMTVSKSGGAKHDYDRFAYWTRLFGSRIVSHLRWFMMNTGTSRILFILEGSDEELKAVEREEVHQRSSAVEGMGVAITHFNGHPIDENVPARVEYAIGDVLRRLEQLVAISGNRRLSIKGLQRLAKYCDKKLEANEDDSDNSEDESEDEGEGDNEEGSEQADGGDDEQF